MHLARSLPGRFLRHHTDPVRSAKFSPDGTKIVTASYDETAAICNVKTGKVLRLLKHHTTMVSSAEFSPDGTKVVTAGDETVAICDAETGEVLVQLEDHKLSTWYASLPPSPCTSSRDSEIPPSPVAWRFP